MPMIPQLDFIRSALTGVAPGSPTFRFLTPKRTI